MMESERKELREKGSLGCLPWRSGGQDSYSRRRAHAVSLRAVEDWWWPREHERPARQESRGGICMQPGGWWAGDYRVYERKSSRRGSGRGAMERNERVSMLIYRAAHAREKSGERGDLKGRER